MAIPTCTEARKIDLVNYLSSLGYHPIKIQGSDYWYYSPFRKERTASFKVNRSMNVFYDHGSGQGGNIIDFGIIYHKLNVSSFLQMLSEDFMILPGNNNHSPLFKTESHSKTSSNQSRVEITDVRKLSDKRLLGYLQQRSIDRETALEFCKEVEFTIRYKKQIAIGFANDKGGYEIRNSSFKGSSSPKASSSFDNGKPGIKLPFFFSKGSRKDGVSFTDQSATRSRSCRNKLYGSRIKKSPGILRSKQVL